MASTSTHSEPLSPFRRAGAPSQIFSSVTSPSPTSRASPSLAVNNNSMEVEEPKDAKEATTENNSDEKLSKFDLSSDSLPISKPIDAATRKKLLASIGASGATDMDGEEGAESRSSFARDPVDNAGRKPGDEGYNPKECRIPSDVYAKMTAAKKQYWDYKRNHFDEVVFFQQGDFFNLFANDADIGVTKFGLLYNKSLDSVGFNRKQLKDWATKFANRGYKVTVLEQDSTATTEEDKAKKKSQSSSASSSLATKKKATEDRSVTNKITAGTVSDFEMFDESSARYLLVIAEAPSDPSNERSAFGISFIDTSTYEWGITHFADDPKCSQLETLLLRLKPKEILYQRMGMEKRTKKIIEINLGGSVTMSFLPKFPDYARTHALLSEYFDTYAPFTSLEAQEAAESETNSKSLPFALYSLHNRSLGVVDARDAYITQTSQLEAQLALSSVGAAISYFKDLTRKQATTNPDDPRVITSVDNEMVQFARYHLYSVHSDPNQSTMILDAVALANLCILENDEGGTDRGTLLSILDYCTTAFGKRKLREFLCHPLRRADDILLRQSIVRWFFERPSIMESGRALISKTKDMERLITRAESKSISLPFFLDLLDSLEIIIGFIETLKTQTSKGKVYSPIDRYCDIASKSAKKLSNSILPIDRVESDDLEENMVPQPLQDMISSFPDLSHVLAFYGFDRISARNDNMITPVPGTNEAFDTAQGTISDLKSQLEERLAHYRKELKDGSLTYHFSKTENYSIVVSRSSTNIPSDWVSTKAKSGNRYKPPEVSQLAADLEEAENDLQRASVGALMSCLESFVSKGFSHLCAKAISIVAHLDVLMSISRYSCNAASESEVCLPEPFVTVDSATKSSPILLSNAKSHLRRAQKPMFEVTSMKHPFVTPANGARFIPNHLYLGSKSDSPPILLVTGPNMGGKSTLLRQVCIITIMAQLGCYVPAESCRFTPVDRVFTRIGARDNLIAGQSTFMVELEETAKILTHSTADSLVILDELGRGTSTFDGYALAYAVLQHFSEQSARVLFSTHYHKLTQEFTDSHTQKVQQGHMACQEENGSMTFLYQLSLGPCPNSFGLEVAAMAHIPHSVLTRASIMSDMFEVLVDRKKSIKAGNSTSSDFLTPGSSALSRFSFSRLLKLLSSAQKITTSSGAEENAEKTRLNFLKADASRLWRQVRFIDAQTKISLEETS